MRATDPAELSKAGMVPNRKRRCYQRRSGAPTRGTGPLRLALAGATRSGSAGVGSPSSRSAGEATPRSSGMPINFRPAAITNRDIAASILSGLSSGFSAHSHQRSKERRANFKRVLFQRQFTDKLHDAIFDDIG